VGAHIVLGAGDQHILDAVAKYLPGPFGPITTIASGPVPEDSDERLGAQITTALDEITGEAVSAVGDLVASAATGPAPGAVRGIQAAAWQLAEQQVAVLLVASGISQDAIVGSYRTAPVRWPASRRRRCCAAEPLPESARPGPEEPLPGRQGFRPGCSRARWHGPGRHRG
jgi:hypothetical protein